MEPHEKVQQLKTDVSVLSKMHRKYQKSYLLHCMQVTCDISAENYIMLPHNVCGGCVDRWNHHVLSSNVTIVLAISVMF